jgi:2-polyprenyl-6-methoxyphenol hydroxylase-like FAD-dependent oxidoreductase
VVFPKGHALFYLIPGPDPAEDYLNWSMHTPLPPVMNPDSPMTAHPGCATKQHMAYLNQMAEEHLPQFFKTLVCNAAQNNISIHPVFDESPNRYVDDGSQMLLMGDAGPVLRPHTGAGAGKALQEVFSLRDLASVENAIDELKFAHGEK